MGEQTYGGLPEEIGVFPLPAWQEFMHYMYLPVRITEEGGTQFAVPPALRFAESLLVGTIMEERARGNDWRYVYLTARRGYATPGNPLNRPGWHADGFGTPDINYVWTDRFPTWFADQPFYGISEDHVVSLQQFERQINPTRITRYRDCALLRLDQRHIHAAPEIPAPGGVRSFLKVSFSDDRYDLLGNSHNYGLDYDWPMHDRAALRNDPASAGKDSAGER